jgi:hypothetical protein
MLNCLGQVDLFTALDYNSHILLVAKAGKNKSVLSPDSEISQFLVNAALLQDVNEEIFDFLGSV